MYIYMSSCHLPGHVQCVTTVVEDCVKLAHESHVQLSVTELTTLPSGRQEVVFAELATAAQPSSKLAPTTIHQERSDLALLLKRHAVGVRRDKMQRGSGMPDDRLRLLCRKYVHFNNIPFHYRITYQVPLPGSGQFPRHCRY